MTTRAIASLAALSLMACTSAALAEPMKIDGTVTDVIGRHLVVGASTGKVVVDLGPSATEQSALKTGDKVTIEGDLKKDDRLRADRITLSDGKIYEVSKKKTWFEWLTGKPAAVATPFTKEEAKKIATDKGYVVTGDLTPDKKHYVGVASKSGKSLEIDVHRDGKIEESVAFGIPEAKKVASDKGFVLTSEPIPYKKLFVANATKDGKKYEIDMRRDGSVKQRIPFSIADAEKLAGDKGYAVVGEPKFEKQHFEMLGKKDNTFFELHAHRDGSLKEIRKVTKTDLVWGPMIQ